MPFKDCLTGQAAGSCSDMAALLASVLFASGLAAFFCALHEVLLILRYLWFPPRSPVSREPGLWPAVTVQAALYNEPAVAVQCVEAMLALEYPGQLEIQFLDDSTDETTELLRGALQARDGVRKAVILHRTHREGYKAGALASGLKQARGDLIAVFDADFVPSRDFLLRMVPLFSSGERIGMVQARWEFSNRTESWLTRSMAVGIENHFVLEQESRFRSGLWCNFNGTAGIWRRQAIEDAGGWSSDTLTEDVDLSYRAQMKGWSFVFASNVTALCELPPRISTFRAQQMRWCRGCTQTARKLGGALLRADAPLVKRVFGLLHVLSFSALPALLLNAVFWLPSALAGGAALEWISKLNAAFLGVSSCAVLVSYAMSQRMLHADWLRRLLGLPGLLLIGSGLTLSGAGAWIAGISGRRAEFVRTEKFAGTAGRRKPEAGRGGAVAAHALFAIYMAGSTWYSWQIGAHWMTPLLAIQGVAALFVAAAEAREIIISVSRPASEVREEQHAHAE